METEDPHAPQSYWCKDMDEEGEAKWELGLKPNVTKIGTVIEISLQFRQPPVIWSSLGPMPAPLCVHDKSRLLLKPPKIIQEV